MAKSMDEQVANYYDSHLTEARRAEVLAEKLRSPGIDPDSIQTP